ncbi:MAG: hypothetical protein J6Y02_06635 [Pseudobutyrivibrio sp.]|nr:hypothetical protein [Pseudobutyrivibrio sp.]
MNYAILQANRNSSFLVAKEPGADLEKAKLQYHQLAAALINDTGKVDALIMLVDENLNPVDGKYQERIEHEAENTTASE